MFSKRKNSGVTLAHVFVKDIKKNAARDQHELSPCFKDKALTGDGFTIVAGAMLKSLRGDEAKEDESDSDVEKDRGHVNIRLEALDLSNNQLTTKSLRALAPIIETSRSDIKHLNLSNNNIEIRTAEQIADWEEFLDSFNHCRRMRRLDFSGNNLSNPLSVETILRVYCRNRAIDPLHLERDRNEINGLTHATSGLQLGQFVEDLSQKTYLKVREGLRSIPYLILSNTQLDDAGVLHLSHIIAAHYWPQHLMQALKEGSDAFKRKLQDDSTKCFGIVYDQNPAITAAGKKLLERAEAARQELLGFPALSESIKNSYVDPLHNPTPVSTLWYLHAGEGEALTLLLTFPWHGVRSVKIWHAALKMQSYARGFLRPQSTSQVKSMSQVTTAPSRGVIEFSRKPVPSNPPRTSALAQEAVQKNPQMPQYYKGSAFYLIKKHTREKLLKQYRDEHNGVKFPNDLCIRILAEASGADGLLSTRQQRDVVAHARSKMTLTTEIDGLAKGQAHQVLKMLEAMGCLTYRMRMSGDPEE
ncbi:hypothetical protein EJ08DRAFT_736281 [Tothia fuscella]|uniref:Uncharacterized protein n=1 Tax=Tothia fuscella TaxID=1048955 RepID=A0A9P4TW25_9PEZI|nr:hypothetical protein EJ08DRAFT_736281 [Tothia fuscella]